MRVATVISSLVLAALAAPVPAADEPRPILGERTYASIRDHVLPSEDELAFRKLGWRSSLWQAVVEAREADRPILLWAMNGHPLGCT